MGNGGRGRGDMRDVWVGGKKVELGLPGIEIRVHGGKRESVEKIVCAVNSFAIPLDRQLRVLLLANLGNSSQMTTGNLASLTRSHGAIAAKKRAKSTQINEILFDDDARRYSRCRLPIWTLFDLVYREFLTGFHKRKLAKADAARKKAVEREKQERLENRREVSLSLSPVYVRATNEYSNAANCENGPLKMLLKSKRHTALLGTVRSHPPTTPIR